MPGAPAERLGPPREPRPRPPRARSHHVPGPHRHQVARTIGADLDLVVEARPHAARALHGLQPGRVQVLMGDGATRILTSDVDPNLFKALGTPDGREDMQQLE